MQWLLLLLQALSIMLMHAFIVHVTKRPMHSVHNWQRYRPCINALPAPPALAGTVLHQYVLHQYRQ
jgi:hypothetical protein